MSGDAIAGPRVYHVGMAVGPAEVEAVVFDLPGCQCVGRDRAEALALLPVVIAEHLAWLDQHGDVTRDAFPFELKVAEEVEVASLADIAGGEFCFEHDRVPPKREEIETAVRRMAYARKDLLDTVRHLPDAVLDWQPPASAVITDEWAPEVRNIRCILGHIARSDNYYAGNVGKDPWRGVKPGESPDIFEERQRAIERLRGLSDAELTAVWEQRRPWQSRGVEQWTVRKVLRRMIAHERFHTKEIEQQLAWLLLGAPGVPR